MDAQAIFNISRDIIWSVLPFFFAWLVYQLKNSKVNMDRLAFIIRQANELVAWVEEEFPNIPYIDKINKVIDMLIKALEDAGYNIGEREELEYLVKAAFNRYKKQYN